MDPNYGQAKSGTGLLDPNYGQTKSGTGLTEPNCGQAFPRKERKSLSWEIFPTTQESAEYVGSNQVIFPTRAENTDMLGQIRSGSV